MGAKILILLVCAIVAFGAALFSYVGGRIILPQMNLGAPEFMAWFWFHTLITLPLATITAWFKS